MIGKEGMAQGLEEVIGMEGMVDICPRGQTVILPLILMFTWDPVGVVDGVDRVVGANIVIPVVVVGVVREGVRSLSLQWEM